MNPEIRSYNPEDFDDIKHLFPAEWKFDFTRFLNEHSARNYFHGYSMLINKKVIGFGNIMIFGNICWIGNIVVSEPFRNQGLGTIITEYLIDKGRKSDGRTFNLVATGMGESIYMRLGFETELYYEFYRPASAKIDFEPGCPVREATKDDLESILELDFRINAEKREELIINYLSGTKVIHHANRKINGIYIPGFGNGLILSAEPESGIELLKVKIKTDPGTVVIPENNRNAKNFLIRCGYKEHSRLPRMRLGEKYSWSPQFVFSRATGYCG